MTDNSEEKTDLQQTGNDIEKAPDTELVEDQEEQGPDFSIFQPLKDMLVQQHRPEKDIKEIEDAYILRRSIQNQRRTIHSSSC